MLKKLNDFYYISLTLIRYMPFYHLYKDTLGPVTCNDIMVEHTQTYTIEIMWR